MAEVRVVAATADTKNATLYLENGETMTIPQGDYRLKALMDEIMPIIAKKQVAVVNLDNYSVYGEFQKKTNGFVRFFKVLKEKVVHLFDPPVMPEESSSEDSKEEVSDITAAPTPVTAPLPKVEVAVKETNEQIIAQATPIQNAGEEKLSDDETIIAVTKEGTIVPEMEKLEAQIVHATASGNTEGMENFIKRISAAIGQYGHSVKDVIKFMERGDLPVANDGSIIAYKILRKTHEEGIFVDCHTGKVRQRVGSFVVVDPSLVDRNRNNECSNGLHIARRAYLGSFDGDVCVLVKLAPEDVVTVPHGDPNKVRVCGYHILGVLPDESFRKLRANAPMTNNPQASALLAQAIEGKHIGKIEEVRIMKQQGGDVRIKPLKGAAEASDAEQIRNAKAFDDKDSVQSVSPKELNKKFAEAEAKAEATEQAPVATESLVETKEEPQVTETLPEATTAPVVDPEPVSEPVKETSKPKSNAQKVREAFDAKDYNTVLAIKRTAKVSFQKLGLSADEVAKMGEVTSAITPFAEPKVKAPKAEKVEPKKEEPKVAQPAIEAPAKDWARYYYMVQDWVALYGLKKAKKVNWKRFGFTNPEINQIIKNKPE